ncbi:flagellin lysine-N-methylase [Aliiglaciecola sp. CAU 1673]|uniref:flagellin lysine-N-methylase n=1 Tax=Aliiglaciecola sp. CAU 1673 TaxID=3032595 RepID=UPI0023DC1F91|nr:flagellin lysine-N-methylase [Aliiglaciecola sp. CAU 1673]MDF2179452.1 flagellin lysine-N-methylase [Aliiglaciecola sp. CAU 1673]
MTALPHRHDAPSHNRAPIAPSASQLKQIVVPKFYKTFQCIGAECENHCCHDWTVTLDKDTYQKYKKHGDIKVRQIAQKHTSSCGQHSLNYRQIKMDKDGNCPFLDTDRLCYLHKYHGEEILPATCQIYPREDRLMGTDLVSSLSISCPEAARNILLDPSAMVLDLEPLSARQALPKFYLTGQIDDIETLRLFKDAAFAGLLAENTETVEGRLYNLGFLFRLTAQRLAQKEALRPLFTNFTQLIHDGKLNDLFAKTQPAQKAQEFVTQQLLGDGGFIRDNQAFTHYQQRAFKKVISKTQITQAADSNSPVAEGRLDLKDFYNSHCRQGFTSLVDSHGHAFINFFLHWVYSTPFDLTNADRLFARFAQFTLKFFYIRLICSLLADDEEHGALLVGVIHSISRRADHDTHLANEVYQRLQAGGMAQHEHFLGLIKV